MKQKNIKRSKLAFILSISVMPLTKLLLILAILSTLINRVILISFYSLPILASLAILFILEEALLPPPPEFADDIIIRSKGITDIKSIKNQLVRYLVPII